MPEPACDFYSLTPEKILDAVELQGLRCTGRCLALNSMENRVYEVEIEVPDPSQVKSRYDLFRVAKFYRPGRWNREQILEEHRFLLELEANELPVVAPLRFPGGDTLAQLEEGKIWYAVFRKVGGRLMDEPSLDQLDLLGRLIARIHTIAATSPVVGRPEISPQTYGRRSLEFLLNSKLLPELYRERFSQLVEFICGISEGWFAETATQRIHGDFHVGNVLWADDGPKVLDFDDLANGPCVQDLWLLAPGRVKFA